MDEADLERARILDTKGKDILSKSFIQEYKTELTTLLDATRGRTNKPLIGRTPLGQLTKLGKGQALSRNDKFTSSNLSEMVGERHFHTLAADPIAPFRSPMIPSRRTLNNKYQ